MTNEKSIYDLYETDVDLEIDGVWVQLKGGIQVKVAALGNENHVAAMETIFAPHRGLQRRGALDKDVEEELHTKAICKSVLLDWKNMVDREGKPLPYNFQNAYDLLMDPTMKRFKADILVIAQEAESFKKQDDEDSVGNSSKSSSGKSNTGTKSKKSKSE